MIQRILKKMNSISDVFRKKEMKRQNIRVEALKTCATDYSGTLMFLSLHDKYDFGNGRLERITKMFETLGDQEKGFIHEWKNYLISRGLKYPVLEKMSIDFAKYICTEKKDRIYVQEVANIVAASFIVIMYCVSKEFGFAEKRLNDLVRYVKDEIYVVRKREVSIMEFMECLHVECNVYNEILEEYKRVKGVNKLPIYGEEGTKWIKK